MFEGVDYHNQSKHFLYTANPGPTLNLPDYVIKKLHCDKYFLEKKRFFAKKDYNYLLDVVGTNLNIADQKSETA